MKKDEIVRILSDAEVTADFISPAELLGIVYGKHFEDEYNARQRIVIRMARAKVDAGFKRSVNFFDDVWPVVLAKFKQPF